MRLELNLKDLKFHNIYDKPSAYKVILLCTLCHIKYLNSYLKDL